MRVSSVLLITLLFISIGYAEDAYICAEAGALAYGREIVIFKSGYAYEEGHSTTVYKRLHRLSKSQLNAIERAIADARFFSLPDRIDPVTYTEDADTSYSIWVKTSQVDKMVDLEAPSRAKDQNAASRFMMIWDVINQIIPEKP